MKRNFTTPVNLAGLTFAVLLLTWTAPASAMQILDAADHAELEAVISDRSVSRITLANDRVARVIRGPDGFTLEHDKSRGDLYLRPLKTTAPAREALTLFIGTVKGFTYRLALRVVSRDSAQILIRNAAAAPDTKAQEPIKGRVAALVALVRAVARREVLPDYAIEAQAGAAGADGLAALEVWRGPRFSAHVIEVKAEGGSVPETLMDNLAPGVAALWLAERGSGPSGGRLAVAVRETSQMRASR